MVDMNLVLATDGNSHSKMATETISLAQSFVIVSVLRSRAEANEKVIEESVHSP
jgi:hypothetical protein